MVVYPNDKFVDDAGMTREETRRENARKLASGKGGKTEFARLVAMEPSQVSQLIGPKPTKNIGNSIARRIERAYQLPEGWIDVSHPEFGMQSDDEDALTSGSGLIPDEASPAQVSTHAPLLKGAADAERSAGAEAVAERRVEEVESALIRIAMLVETYRLASPTDRHRLDRFAEGIRRRTGAVDKAEPSAS